jgi:hypothetical protein
MADRRNKVGGAYALTVFAPLIEGHAEAAQAYIDALGEGPESPLARLAPLHLSRIQVFHELVYQGEPQVPTPLGHKYLVFTSSIDGGLDPYLDALASRVPEADEWWGHCIGYPGRGDKAAFRAWIRAHKVDTNLFASAYPKADVAAVREALALREQVVEFAADAHGLGAAELQERFLASFGSGS